MNFCSESGHDLVAGAGFVVLVMLLLSEGGAMPR